MHNLCFVHRYRLRGICVITCLNCNDNHNWYCQQHRRRVLTGFGESFWIGRKWHEERFCRRRGADPDFFARLLARLKLDVTCYSDVIMSAKASQITSLTFVYSTVYSSPDHRKYQSSALLYVVRGIHRWPLNTPHKWPVTREMFLFDYVIMLCYMSPVCSHCFYHWYLIAGSLYIYMNENCCILIQFTVNFFKWVQLITRSTKRT